MPFWAAAQNAKFLELMEVPRDACVKINGRVVDNGLQHFVDEQGNIYDYLDEIDAAVRTEHAAAYTPDDQPLEFRKEFAEPVPVMTFEEAFWLLNAI